MIGGGEQEGGIEGENVGKTETHREKFKDMGTTER